MSVAKNDYLVLSTNSSCMLTSHGRVDEVTRGLKIYYKTPEEVIKDGWRLLSSPVFINNAWYKWYFEREIVH